MTIIIGLKCTNGIVLGADGAATLGNAAGLRTVIQPVAKLNIIKEKVILGLSGPVGLSQLYCDGVAGICDSLREEHEPDVCRKLRERFLKDVEIVFRVSALASQVVGSVAQASILHQTLVALATRGTPHLIQFDYQCNPEMATNDLPFVAIGSGQNIADPFLAFLRHIFWEDHLPSLSEGRFAVMWTLRHAIRTAPGGIAEPIEMATLEMNGTQSTARKLSKNELKEHEEAIQDAEKYLQEFKRIHQPTSNEAQPPQPTARLGA